MSMVRHFALVMPIVASPWGRRQRQLSVVVCLSLPSSPFLCRHALCFWLCLSMAVIRWKTQGNRFDSLRPKANEIENIRESCEPKLNRRRLQSTRSLNPLSGRCIIKYPFRCAKASAEFPRMRRRVQLIGSGNSSHWNNFSPTPYLPIDLPSLLQVYWIL